jgi:thioredoxin reductase (NADPH)
MAATKTVKVYDTLIIGGGPAGLCAAINGASEGMKVAIITQSLGGQARESSYVENYPLPFGMQNGVSGDLLVNGFTAQAAKFEAEIFCPASAAHIEVDQKWKVITTNDFQEFRSKCVILSMGLNYRRLENTKGLGRYMGRGIYYGVPGHLRKMTGKVISIVGAANSAGQAALKLAETAAKVYILARSPLEKSMSTYLISRISSVTNIEVKLETEVTEVFGDRSGKLDAITLKGSDKKMHVDYLFIYIGAVPHTAWLMGDIELDKNKFILTDVDLPTTVEGRALREGILPCETSMDGVFAAGDVRFGQAVKRITGAIGDGIQALQSCHRYCSRWEEGSTTGV